MEYPATLVPVAVRETGMEDYAFTHQVVSG
jgi:hypothetical protein